MNQSIALISYSASVANGGKIVLPNHVCDQWTWVLASMDFTDNSISLISYRSSKVMWSLQANLNPWTFANVNASDLVLSIGNQNPLGQSECSWLGFI